MEEVQSFSEEVIIDPDHIQLLTHLEKFQIKNKLLSDELKMSQSWVTRVLNGEIELSEEHKANIEEVLAFSNFKFKNSTNG
jgi:translation initiation factor 1 (eIF-1/SUI1)